MIDVYWLNEERTIIRLDYIAPIVSWEEYQEAIDTSCELAKQVKHRVTMLHNPNHAAMPAGNAMEQLRLAAQKIPSNVDSILMVINNRIARRIIASAMYVFRLSGRYKIVQSLEEAESLLAERSS